MCKPRRSRAARSSAPAVAVAPVSVPSVIELSPFESTRLRRLWKTIAQLAAQPIDACAIVQAMLDAHANELDLAKRREKLAEIGAYLRDQAANVFIAHINEPYAASRKVGEWRITSSNALNFEGIRPASGIAA